MRYATACFCGLLAFALDPSFGSAQVQLAGRVEPISIGAEDEPTSEPLSRLTPVSHVFGEGAFDPDPHQPAEPQPPWLERLEDWWNMAYQGIHSEAAYIGNVDDFSLAEWDVSATVLTVPVPGGPPPMLIPSFGVDYFRLPDSLDVPRELYSTSLELNWMRPLREGIMLNVAAAPRLNSDFETSDSRAWRMTGRVLGFFTVRDDLQLALGAVFLGRDDIPVLPGVGVVWNPDPRWQFNLMIPRPRIAWKWMDRGDSQHWLYVGGQLGGNTWAFNHSNGTSDVMNYRDLRLLIGWELNRPANAATGQRKKILRLETGYVFARQVEFEDSPVEFEPGSTWLLRADLNY